jgi:hypothetical protein
MSKTLKLYVPVVTKALKGKKNTYRVTLIGVHNCLTLRGQIPMTRDIMEHLMIQKYRISKGEQFMSIKVSVSPEHYLEMCKEISRKIGGHFQSPVIDMVMGSGQIPIIQILGNKTEVNVVEENKTKPIETPGVADKMSRTIPASV